MTKKSLLTKVILLTALWILLGFVIGNLTAVIISGQEYEHLSHLLSALSPSAPDKADALIQSLKVPSADTYDGEILLQKYNYTPASFAGPNLLIMTAVTLAGLSIPFLLLLFLLYRQYQNNKARIEGLTTYLEEVNAGEDVLLTPMEDQYSILEDQLYKTVTQLRETREAALRERRALADNLADISHQLKTPITSMSLMAQLLSDNCTEENAAYIERLLRQLTRMETLIASLLTLSKLDAGALELERLPVDVPTMLLQATESLEDILHQRQQTLLYHNNSSSNNNNNTVSFLGDITWTSEAILNILKNCSEHTPSGGIIDIEYSENPLYTELIIQDSGRGFDKEELGQIFKRYYKGKTASKDSVGIGLALSKAIIEKQKGILRAENAPEGGARFIIHFYK